MLAIVQLRMQWERLAETVPSSEVIDQLARVYRHAWEAVEDMHGYEVVV